MKRKQGGGAAEVKLRRLQDAPGKLDLLDWLSVEKGFKSGDWVIYRGKGGEMNRTNRSGMGKNQIIRATLQSQMILRTKGCRGGGLARGEFHGSSVGWVHHSQMEKIKTTTEGKREDGRGGNHEEQALLAVQGKKGEWREESGT